MVVEAWAPEYGSPIETESLDPSGATVDVEVEVRSADWDPVDVPVGLRPSRVDFTDGVRRIDARVWLTGADGTTRPGICASYAAGVVTCDGRATIVVAEVRRGLFGPAGAPELTTQAGAYAPIAAAGQDLESLSQALQERMIELEIEAAESASRKVGTSEADARDRLLVADGPLRGRQHLTGAIGYIKTHQVGYLPEALTPVVAALKPGQRTPLFLTQTTWSRYSWYLRLPGGAGHPWSGVVRCEASTELPLEDARFRADQSASALPEFAAAAHKDPRAPQNLYPIGGLERELRRRLGDSAWVYRALRTSAARWVPGKAGARG
ncbi:MAG: hypothetical protein GEU90_03120 [Gemmatimonas sp.]|nr:hypothetical protein [Gemmatimonas sp.]